MCQFVDSMKLDSDIIHSIGLNVKIVIKFSIIQIWNRRGWDIRNVE